MGATRKDLAAQLREFAKEPSSSGTVPLYPDLLLEVAEHLEQVNTAAPLCEKHEGGRRSRCLVCAGQALQAAISRISYFLGEPNEMETSAYDLHCDETVVVEAVRHKLHTMQSQLDRMRGLLRLAHPTLKLYHFRKDGLLEAVQQEMQ